MRSLRWVLLGLVASACGRIAFDPLGGLDPTTIESHSGIVAGDEFSCVLRDDASVWCWGNNVHRIVNPTSGQPSESVPQQVVGLADIVALEAGTYHVCALDESGGVWCWGDNSHGQIAGIADGVPTIAPISVPLRSPAVAISAGGYHTCAILDDATLSCWGKSNYGQGGAGLIAEAQAITDNILASVTSVSLGHYHSCAVSAGTVFCWGNNDQEQLGMVGGNQSRPVALTVAATSVASSGFHTCALADGRFECWGVNYDGQLGTNADTGIGAPSAFDGLVALRTGAGVTCGLRGDGTAWCWGDNFLGTLGDGTPDDSVMPVRVALPGAVVDVAAGVNHGCALLDDGAVHCWGVGRRGQLSHAPMMAQPRPQLVAGLPVVDQISAGRHGICARAASTLELHCWGRNSLGELALPPATGIAVPTATGFTNVDSVSLGNQHGCAVRLDGFAFCWGDNSFGQLGTGGMASGYMPMQIMLGNLDRISAGSTHTCVLGIGDVYCWGRNHVGQLANGTTMDRRAPDLTSVQGVRQLAVGDEHACAIDTNSNQATCWGANDDGEIGNGRTQPMEVPGGVSGGIQFSVVTTGGDHTCGNTFGADLYCWGFNGYGNLGVGDSIDRNTPTFVVSQVNEPIAGRYHTCARVAGVPQCWGSNSTGQLGDGTFDHRDTPTPVVDVGSLPIADGFAPGEDFTCALFGGAVHCWGDNTFGQLGNGTLGFTATPRAITLP